MEKIKANYINHDTGRMEFDHFIVIRKGNNYFAVLDGSGEEITSGKSLDNAAKKAKLLEIGFNIGRSYYGY